jgi:aromatic-L-amino-acid decarboxylase
MLPAAPPQSAEQMDAVLADLDRVVMRGLTHWNHPNFFAYFANTGSAPGVLAELVCAALNNNAMLWKSGPAATELETVVLDWLRQALLLPAGFWGMIFDTASISTMQAIAAAREQAFATIGYDARHKGLFGAPVLRVYASEFVHSSIDKSCITLGIGADNLVKIAVDADFRMIPEHLAEAIQRDRAAGMLPICVVPVIGTTSCASVDPVAAVAEICERERLWMHVDAAYAGPTAMLDECKPLFAGWERADSIVINPHKWLFVPMDLSVLYTRKPDVLKAAFSLVPEYLKTKEGEASAVQNQMDYGIQLGRRFRSLKLWFVMRAFGVEGLQERLREHNALAALFAALVRERAKEAGDMELLAPPMFSLVCFRWKPANMNDEAQLSRLNADLMERVNATREIFIEHTALRGAYTLRFAVGNLATEERHVRRAFEIITEQMQQ